MDKRASSTTPETVPPADALPQEEELLEDDLLVEDISIDGMCGVY